MSTLGLPSINVSFTEAAVATIERSERGIVALIIKDTVPSTNPFEVYAESDIPASLSTDNKEQIMLAMKGYIKAPKKIIVYVVAANATSYTTAFTELQGRKFNYLAIPTVSTDDLIDSVVTWVEGQREAGKQIVAVLPNADDADNEGIINVTTETFTAGDTSYTTEEYCGRIAGLIAGTPTTISCTFAPLPELTDCTRISRSDLNTAIGNGEFVVYFDGEKCKVARGVNSFTTTTSEKGDKFKKIRIVECMDIIFEDIVTTAEDNYIGKYVNSYPNKLLLISAIKGYLSELVTDSLISSYSVDIDLDAQKTYLETKGINVAQMTDQEIKEYNTDAKVFLKASIAPLDTMEEIELPITL